MEFSATVTRRLPAASVLAVVLFALPLLASAPSASASNLKTRVWDFFEDCPLCTDGEGDLSQQSSASNASDCSWRNLFYNRFRYYDPKVGRYISPDPLGIWSGTNVYSFAPNTTGWVDQYGLVEKCPKKRAGQIIEDAQQGKIKYSTHSHVHQGIDVQRILANPDAVYVSTGKKPNLVFRRGGDIVIVGGKGVDRDRVITGYGSGGQRGVS